MKLIGNIRLIRPQRDDSNADIQLHLDKIDYITHKKDGKYYQPFDFVDELDTPLVLTGDCLALINAKHIEEGDYEFQVYDKTEDGYLLNPDKLLTVTLAYDFDANTMLLTAATYAVTIPNDVFNQLKRDRSSRAKKQKQRRSR